jgi:gliding motility-associated transport system permease protein
MKGMGAIYQREMRGYFVSPIAYVVAAVFLLVVGLTFMNFLRSYLSFDAFWRQRLVQTGQEPLPADVHQYLLRRFVTTLGAITLFVLPFLTMGSFAEEHRAGTMELLLTSPVGQRSIVLGKFLAASTLFVGLLLVSLGLTSVLRLYGNPRLATVLIGFLGVWLQGESFLVVGMFISSLTRSQVVAGIGGLGAALLLWLAGLLGDPSSTLTGWLQSLSLVAHFDDFAKGVFDTQHVLFYVCFIFFGLFLTLRSLESLRYR